ncbi:MAG TPA: fibronectin type III domain-containing protein [Blastocatellia bacterium]|nr:fibronectin type III domain-containing protein [Blastocatellia bacterium]
MKISADTFCNHWIGRVGRVLNGGWRTFRGSRAGSPHFVIVLFLGFSVLAAPGCGKVGDPLPPIPRAPLVIDELSVSQQGANMVLSIPIVRTPRSPKLQRIDIYRLIETTDAPLGLPQDAFSTRATIVNSIEGGELPLTRSVTSVDDALDLRSGAPNTRYRYAVRLVTSSGVAADFSNYALITPLFDLSMPPTDLKAEQRENEIEITWSAPNGNENGTTPANVAGYNIYRQTPDAPGPPVKLTPQPLSELRYVDRSFQFGTAYRYIVRPLSTLSGNSSLVNAIEGNPSAPLNHIPVDSFPPVAPTPITIASIGAMVSLYWPLNSEPDVAGYNIYRTDNEQAAPDKWVKLNPQLYKTASFRDDRVEVGKQYYYQITAVDAYGNESPRSATVSETVAP